MRDGASYLAGLNDGRAIFIDGQRVESITEHVAFRNAVHSYAALYDFQGEPARRDEMTFEIAETGRRANKVWQLPRSRDQLSARRLALEAWAELSYGLLGRSPDHVATSLGGMIVGLGALSRSYSSGW